MDFETSVEQLAEVIGTIFNHKRLSSNQKKAGFLIANAIKELSQPKPNESKVIAYIKEAEHLLPSPPEALQNIYEQQKTNVSKLAQKTDIPEAVLDPAYRRIQRPRGPLKKRNKDQSGTYPDGRKQPFD